MSKWLLVRTIFDRVVALSLLMLLSPLIALLALAVRLDDGPPSFVSLPRIGRAGRRFQIRKLRSMRATGANGRATGSSIASPGDGRITRSGAVLRRNRLDELPQLWNVVRGEMTLLGPRPETPDFVDSTDSLWAYVLRAAPGIAGVTQVLLADWEGELLRQEVAEVTYRDTVLPQKLELDRWYVNHASPLVDMLIGISLVQRYLLRRRYTILHRRAARPGGPPVPDAVAEVSS